MKLNCGLTYEDYVTYKTNWHRVFALFPVRIASHDCRWFEYVERKYEDSPWDGVCNPTYRVIDK